MPQLGGKQLGGMKVVIAVSGDIKYASKSTETAAIQQAAATTGATPGMPQLTIPDDPEGDKVSLIDVMVSSPSSNPTPTSKTIREGELDGCDGLLGDNVFRAYDYREPLQGFRLEIES